MNPRRSLSGLVRSGRLARGYGGEKKMALMVAWRGGEENPSLVEK